MNKLYDVLEICLKELENGASLDSVLARYPDQARELRPILKTAKLARRMAVPAPSSDVVRAGRARLLQRAAEMREGKYAPSRKRVIPTFKRFALSFSMAAVLLLSGTGILGASASALPGENLYPVKRSWEDVRLLLVFNSDSHDALKSHFENERLHEVSKLLEEGRDEPIRFVGIYTLINGTTYISGLPVAIIASTQLPVEGLESGKPVAVSGYTNANGVVEVTAITLLPAGTYVPAGQPVEVESTDDGDSDSDSNPAPDQNTDSESGSDTGSSNAPKEKTRSDIHYFEAEGTVEALSEFTLVLNGKTVYFDNVRISGDLIVGARVEIKGYYASDGRFMVTEVEVKQWKSDSNDDGSDSDSNDDGSDSNHDNDDDDGHDGHHDHDSHD